MSMSDKNNNNETTLSGGLRHRMTANARVPGLAWFYALWVMVAALSVFLGHSSMELGSALFLLGGIVSTNFFFLTVRYTEPDSPNFARLLANYQTIMGIAWTSAYFYFTAGSGDLVLGMYMTVLMFAVFYLETGTFLRLCIGTLASYLLIVAFKLVATPAGDYPLADSIRFVVLSAITAWTYMFARQLRELRNQLQYRNEELQNVVERVTRIAEQDHLTKSYNRRYIMDVLARERSMADRSGETFSVLLFDLDHFKRINDRYGHLVGDQLLTDFANRVKEDLRGMDAINPTGHQGKQAFGRYGGEEFIAVLPGADLLGAQRCADRIRGHIAEQPFREECRITVSVGVAQYRLGETVPQLLTRADQALYQAKREGRNRVRCSERPVEKSSPTVPRLRILK